MDLYKALTEKNMTEEKLRDIFEYELKEATARIAQEKTDASILTSARENLAYALVNYAFAMAGKIGYKLNCSHKETVDNILNTLSKSEKSFTELDAKELPAEANYCFSLNFDLTKEARSEKQEQEYNYFKEIIDTFLND